MNDSIKPWNGDQGVISGTHQAPTLRVFTYNITGHMSVVAVASNLVKARMILELMLRERHIPLTIHFNDIQEVDLTVSHYEIIGEVL